MHRYYLTLAHLFYSNQLSYIEKFDVNYGKKLGDPVTNITKWKQAGRHGVPDKHKRRFILCLFGVDPEAARN